MNRSRVAAGAARVVVCLLSAVGLADAQSVPSPWMARDIGEPALSGSSSFSNGVFSIDAGGHDVSGTVDQFYFVYQPVSGDVDIRARIDSMTNAHTWSKAGLMVRGGLSAGSAHGYVFLSAANGTGFEARQTDGIRSTSLAGPADSPPMWLRVARTGSTITAFSSTDGETWTEMGRQTVELPSTVYVGIAVASRDRSTRTTVAVSNAQVTAPAAPVEAALPEGQWNSDIGSPPVAGSVSYSAGRYTIRGSGNDIWGAADQFHYVYQSVAGDVDLVARIESLTAAAGAKVGVMLRESLAPGSRHATALVAAGQGIAFQRRREPDTWSESTSGGAGAPPVWVRLVRQGMLISAFRSTNGVDWTAIGSDTIGMAETVYVGLALTNHNVDASATAIVTDLRVTTSPTEVNKPPAVMVSAPTNGATFSSPATVTLAASATDPDGTIQRVEFRQNGVLIGSDTTAPFALGVTLSQGAYAITAVAIDDDGATAVSDPVNITVTAPADLPRAVAFTASADHDTLVVRYVLEVYGVGATPGVSAPLATQDLGKPTPDSTGDVTVDCSEFFAALVPGSYVASVNAVGSEASARSAPVTFTR